MEDLSSCLITKDENKLPYTPVIVNVEQDGSIIWYYKIIMMLL